jgi:hypothetical protein
MWPIQQIYFHKSCLTSKYWLPMYKIYNAYFSWHLRLLILSCPCYAYLCTWTLGSLDLWSRDKKKAVRWTTHVYLTHKKLMIWRKLCFLGPTIGETSDPQNSCAERCMHPRRLPSSSWPVSGVRVKCWISTFMKTSTYMHRIMNDDLELLNPLQKFLWEGSWADVN